MWRWRHSVDTLLLCLRYGYRFTAKVDPLILSPDDLEEISKFGQEINEAGEEEFTDIGRENKGLNINRIWRTVILNITREC